VEDENLENIKKPEVWCSAGHDNQGQEAKLEKEAEEEEEKGEHETSLKNATSQEFLASEEEAQEAESDVLLVIDDESTPSKDPRKKVQFHQGGDGKISIRAATSNLITCMIGASVLSLPHIVAKCGWVLGPLCLAFAGFVSCRGCLVNQAIDATAKTRGSWPRSIGDVAEVCFGLRGRVIVVSFTCFFQVAKCGVYLLVIGTNLHFWDSAVTNRQCTLLATLVCLRFVFLRDITAISRWSFIGVIASGFYLLTIAAGGFQAAAVLPPEDRPWDLWPVRASELPSMFAVMLYAYSPADVLPVLKSDMSDPSELPTALYLSHAAVVLIYVCLSAAGYFGWGRGVEGNVLESMCDHPGCPGTIPETAQPGAKWSVGYVLSFAVVSNLMVTIPVVMYCVFRVLESQYSHLKSSNLINGVMRVSIMLCAVSVAVFVPFFVEVLSVISTALLVSLQVFLPVAVTFALSRKGASVRCGAPEACLLGLGILVFVVGMASSLQNLQEAIARGTS